jgi:hypothetical protein
VKALYGMEDSAPKGTNAHLTVTAHKNASRQRHAMHVAWDTDKRG